MEKKYFQVENFLIDEENLKSWMIQNSKKKYKKYRKLC